jgi:hypothetical protein
MASQVPPGKRFTHVYTDRGEPIGDSARMRVRLRSLVFSIRPLHEAGHIVTSELGIEFHNWYDFFDNAPLRDILDFITVGYNHLIDSRAAFYPDQWLRDVQRVFSEENIHYRLDHQGGVHFNFDPEFTRATVAALSALQPQRYANSLDAYNKSLAALAEAPPDGKGAIRATFTAIEGLFRLMFPEVQRLAAREASRFGPLIERAYQGDRVAQETCEKLFHSLRGWIDAAHCYRHEEGKPDTVAQPPLTLPVCLISTGAAHLRWLAELDAATSK